MSQKTAWPEESRSGVGIALRGCKVCVPAVTNPMPSPRTATSARIPADPGALGRRLTRLTSRAALMLAQIESFLPGVPAAKLMNVGDEIVEVDGVVDLLNCLSGSSKP